MFQLPDYVEIPHFSILTPAKNLIEAVWNKILHQTDISLTFADRILLLKFMDVDSYVYGDTQLIYFVEIREHIRNKTSIELALVSLSKEQAHPNMFTDVNKHVSKCEFPPIAIRF